LRLHFEKVAEESKVGLDAQKDLTKMNKNSYMIHRVWVEVMELKTTEI
jgi:hypothetical protein